jgi:phage head maturation protease
MDALTRSARLSRLLQGRGYAITGSLLTDTSERGAVVLLDPATGGELAAEADPAWVLSTPREATDGHIVQMHWDLSRGAQGGPGVPVLYNHNRDALAGQWRALAVAEVDTASYSGEALIGRSYLPGVTALGRDVAEQVRAGLLRSTSIGWIPGEQVRRSELNPLDPSWREAAEDECGMPAEGYVMGSEAAPNRLLEASLVTIPAQADAVSLEHAQRRALDDLGPILRADDATIEGAIRSGSMDRLLFIAARDPRVTAYIQRAARAELSALLAEAGDNNNPAGHTLGDLFK